MAFKKSWSKSTDFEHLPFVNVADLPQPQTETTTDLHIRTAPCPACVLCGGRGELVYSGLSDRLFSASGTYDLKKCPDIHCGLIWPDPMPLTEDIGKAYRNYYTHMARNEAKTAGLVKRLYRGMKRGYWAGKYGYNSSSITFAERCLGKLIYLLPISRGAADGDIRFLNAVPQGRLLDVGCGSGDWLLSMREMGWQVEGVDFDDNAVKAARQQGLEVQCGSVEQQKFASGRFDAVILNHVIEHVPDPVATAAECRRILKPGGKLVIFTPNAASLGHQVFKQDWRGLEPPRHLHVFSTRSMPRMLRLAGFADICIRPQIAKSVIYESFLLSRGSGGSTKSTGPIRRARMVARLFNFLEMCVLTVNRSAADCVAAIAVKE